MTSSAERRVIYWHRDLPPRGAEPMGDHTLEATSVRVPGTLAHRDDLWERCYRDLMDRVRVRLEQEIVRLGGNYAHVLTENIAPRRDDRTGEAWMYGRFDYELYRATPAVWQKAPVRSSDPAASAGPATWCRSIAAARR